MKPCSYCRGTGEAFDSTTGEGPRCPACRGTGLPHVDEEGGSRCRVLTGNGRCKNLRVHVNTTLCHVHWAVLRRREERKRSRVHDVSCDMDEDCTCGRRD